MNRLQPYPVAVALSFIFLIVYSICIVIHLVVSDVSWPMARLWEMIFIGFSWISTKSYFAGALEIFLGGFYVAYVFIPLYNYFADKYEEKEGQEMRSLRFLPVVLSVSLFGLITYNLCMLFDLILPQWAMYELWAILLPGFTGLNWSSYFIGLLGIIGYGIYFAALFVPIYNYFRSSELAEVK